MGVLRRNIDCNVGIQRYAAATFSVDERPPSVLSASKFWAQKGEPLIEAPIFQPLIATPNCSPLFATPTCNPCLQPLLATIYGCIRLGRCFPVLVHFETFRSPLFWANLATIAQAIQEQWYAFT